jgi:subfamily B ATP-binding cassette protein MsbA
MAETRSVALIRRFWAEHMRPQRVRMAFAVLFTVLLAGITALYPIVIQQSFDLFGSGDTQVVWLLPPVIVAVTALRGLFMYGQQLAIQGAVLRTIEHLQNALFRALTRADYAVVSAEAPARHAARFTTDATQIRDAMARSVNGMGDALTILGLVASMLWLDWSLALMAAVLYPVAAWPILTLGKRIRRASHGMQDRMGETAALLNESFGAARVVRTYRLEAAEEGRAARAFADLRESLFRIASTRARVDPILEALGGLTVAARARLRRLAGGERAGDHRRVHRLRRRRADRLAPGPLAGLAELRPAGGLAGLARVFAVIDAPRRVADAPVRRRCPPAPAASASRTCPSPTRAAPSRPCAASPSPPSRARPSRWSARPAPASPPPSPCCRACTTSPRVASPRRRRAARQVTLASLRDSHRLCRAGGDAVRRHRARQHRLRPPRRQPRRGRGGCPRRPGARLHRGAAGRLRHAARPRRRAAFRRPAPAHQPWPAPCCATRASSCWTKPHPRSTPRTRRPCRRPSPRCARAAPRW